MSIRVAGTTVCVRSHNVVAREIEGDIIIIPLVAGVGDAGDELYALNETGRAIWQRLDGHRTLADVVCALEDEFDTAREDIEPDVMGFAAEMVRMGLLSIKD